MAADTTAITVTQLTQRIKMALERHPGLATVKVTGEVSNLTNHSSGHSYFSLKDEASQVAAVMFRGDVMANGYRFREGELVEATGAISVYAPRGSYQLVVKRVRGAGAGALAMRFEQLKQQLAAQGYFDTAVKLPLPRWASRIAVITSPTGAVIHDIRHTLARRYPAMQVYLLPAKVQGSTAAASLVQALATATRLAATHQLDALILCRGGGSAEDLWCFNEPEVVRAIAAFRTDTGVPTISAVGHETDFSLADFAADFRAPTPTAAAELVSPDGAAAMGQLDAYLAELDRSLTGRLHLAQQRLDDLLYQAGTHLAQHGSGRTARLTYAWQAVQQAAQGYLHTQGQRLHHLPPALHSAIQARLSGQQLQLAQLGAQLQLHNVTALLHQGYTLTLKDGRRLTSATQVQAGDRLETRFADGSVHSTATGNRD